MQRNTALLGKDGNKNTDGVPIMPYDTATLISAPLLIGRVREEVGQQAQEDFEHA